MTRLDVRPATKFERALRTWLRGRVNRKKPIWRLGDIDTQPWASAMFEGERHRFDVKVSGPASELLAAVDDLTAGLESADLAIPGEFLADITRTDLEYCDIGGELAASVSFTALTLKE